MKTILLIIAPVVGAGLLTGLMVAVFQATTQIQEQTLAFIPKILAVMIALAVFGPWMLNTIVDFVVNLFRFIPQVVG
ncbi:MAG: flagellar biosynthesis protein FliQ [Halanaerobiaceae bacterium]|nr:flagellar biosynthesis protein FliQ [Halanaerobiaceae bacterium]